MSSDWLGDHQVGFFGLNAAPRLDPVRLAMFRNYLAQEYTGPFRHGMGSYEILDMVRRFLGGGRRLDVGGGTASLFWILAVPGHLLTTVSDVEPEALTVLRDFLSSPGALPECYYEAAALFGVAAARAEALRRTIDTFLVFNALGTWPSALACARYDSVTAFGCFAIASSDLSYRGCFHNAVRAVRPGGRLVGADWVRHSTLQTRDYSFVSAENLRRIGSDLGLRVLHVQHVPIHGDETYASVVLWAFEAP